MKPINVGLLGIGTVGGGTFTVLSRNEAEITRRAGRPIRVTQVADKNLELARQVTGGKAAVTDDAFAVVSNPEIDIVVGGNFRQIASRYLIVWRHESGCWRMFRFHASPVARQAAGA